LVGFVKEEREEFCHVQINLEKMFSQAAIAVNYKSKVRRDRRRRRVSRKATKPL